MALLEAMAVVQEALAVVAAATCCASPLVAVPAPRRELQQSFPRPLPGRTEHLASDEWILNDLLEDTLGLAYPVLLPAPLLPHLAYHHPEIQ